jgi:predicted transcriptional regulator
MDHKVSEMLLNQRYWDIFTVTDNCSVKKAIRMMDEKKIGALWSIAQKAITLKI